MKIFNKLCQSEKQKQRSNPVNKLDCLAALAMTTGDNIRDIKGLEHFSYSPIYYIIPFIIILALAYLAYHLYKKRMARIKVETISPPPPDEVALRKLEILHRDGKFEKLGEKFFNFRLSEIFRNYLEGRYKFSASDMTTEEISSLLQKGKLGSKEIDIKPNNLDTIKEILIKTDKVKFAKFRPGRNIAISLIDNAIEFVNITKNKDLECHCESSESRMKQSS